MLFELGFGLAEVVWGVGMAMLENFGEKAGEGLVEGLVDKVFGGGEALEQDRALALALEQNKELAAQFTAAQQNLAQVQAQQNRLKREELELAAQQGAMSLALTQRLAEANLDLGWRKLEQDGLIEREKLDQQRQLAQQEMQLQAWLQGQSLQLQERHHGEILAARQREQAIQIQADWDLQGNLGTIFSRAELEQMQRDARLKLICAQMQVTNNCPGHFQEDVAMEVESQMFEADFGPDVQCLAKFFKDQSVFDTHASRLKGILTNSPVIMAFSRMMSPRIYFHYVLWNSKSAEFLRQGDGKFNRKVNWKQLKRKLEDKAQEQGKAVPEEDILEVLGNYVIALHKLFACYLLDLHAVVDGPIPFVQLRLEQEDWGDLRGLVWPELQPLLDQLQKLKAAREEAFERLRGAEKLREAEEQRRKKEEERERRRQEQQQEQQAEAKRQAAQEAERMWQEREERRRQEEERQRQREGAEAQRREAERRKQLSFALPGEGGTLEFVWVPSGELIMVKGSHRVQVPEFRIGKFPVTQRQYQAIMKTNPSYFQADDLTPKEQKKKLTPWDRPVEKVTWHQAVEFCEELTKILKIEGYAVRLPSETMWEWAARDGENSSLTFAGSNDLNEVGWYYGNAGGKTHPVGQKQANKLGIYDMSGNVWEWCWDHWSSDSNVLLKNGKPLLEGGDNTKRAVRVGSWNDVADDCSSGNRYYYYPCCSFFNLGFRVFLLPVGFVP
ncbi:SUMF1/EgtB/PvdO family nonheme iron enzyme [Prochlorothrix hollandica]|uniref:SUMF1/EgtB/PvdO family nonheme iron enzyme n=1 Tax=Prochlorothrix hollandica TaxID=1223 RepID=UPI00034935AD|nr:SUMF1/EgtB/PvdO family nonheme iron enzyme [Prochlorothrix hollandica]